MSSLRYPVYVYRSHKTKAIVFVGLGAKKRVIRRWRDWRNDLKNAPLSVLVSVAKHGGLSHIELYKRCESYAEAEAIMKNFEGDRKIVVDCRNYGSSGHD